jgi:hypothetical protein
LTCVEGDARADLKRLSGPKPLIVREIWLLVLPEQRRNSAVRKVLDWLIGVTRREASLLLGASASKAEWVFPSCVKDWPAACFLKRPG